MNSFKRHLASKVKNRKFRETFDEEKQLLNLAIRIQEFREETHVSQAALARKAGITQQQLSKIENGINCNTSTLLRVLHALNLRLDLHAEKKRLSA